MLRNKTLHELIKPWSARRRAVEAFLCDVDNCEPKSSRYWMLMQLQWHLKVLFHFNLLIFMTCWIEISFFLGCFLQLQAVDTVFSTFKDSINLGVMSEGTSLQLLWSINVILVWSGYSTQFRWNISCCYCANH